MLNRKLFGICVSASLVCGLTAAAHAAPLAVDTFTYPDGSLTTSPLWSAHSGAAVGPVLVSGGAVSLSQGSSTEDVNTPLLTAAAAGQTYYAGFDLTTASGSNQTYFTHFGRNDATAGFTDFTGRVFTGSVSGGDYTLGIRTASSSSPIKLSQVLSFGTTYRVVYSYEFDTGTTSLWVDPTSIASANVSETLASSASIAIDGLAFRQSSGNALQTLDNLIVATTFDEAALTPEPASLALLGLGSLMMVGRRRKPA